MESGNHKCEAAKVRPVLKIKAISGHYAFDTYVAFGEYVHLVLAGGDEVEGKMHWMELTSLVGDSDRIWIDGVEVCTEEIAYIILDDSKFPKSRNLISKEECNE